jgi:hypothetical protein
MSHGGIPVVDGINGEDDDGSSICVFCGDVDSVDNRDNSPGNPTILGDWDGASN